MPAEGETAFPILQIESMTVKQEGKDMKLIFAIVFSLLLVPALAADVASDGAEPTPKQMRGMPAACNEKNVAGDGIEPPLKQLRQGVPATEVQCADSMTLMLSPQQRPACVKEETAVKLEARGWIMHAKHIESPGTLNAQSIEKPDRDGYPFIGTNWPTVMADFPESIYVNQTVTIPVTYSWGSTNQETGEFEPFDYDYPYPWDEFKLILALPSEFSVLDPDVDSRILFADRYVQHTLKAYAIPMPINYTQVNHGSVQIRLDKEMMFDEDFANILQTNTYAEYFIVKQDGGVRFVSESEAGRSPFYEVIFSDRVDRYSGHVTSPTDPYVPEPRPEPAAP